MPVKRFRYYLRDLFWLMALVAVGVCGWSRGYWDGRDAGHEEFNRAWVRTGHATIWRVDDDGKEFVFDSVKGWVPLPEKS